MVPCIPCMIQSVLESQKRSRQVITKYQCRLQTATSWSYILARVFQLRNPSKPGSGLPIGKGWFVLVTKYHQGRPVGATVYLSAETS